MGILFAKEIEFVKKGEPIKAIKAYRARTGATLKEAKEAVDAYCERNSISKITVWADRADPRKRLEDLITEWRDIADQATEDFEMFGNVKNVEKARVYNHCARQLEDAIK